MPDTISPVISREAVISASILQFYLEFYAEYFRLRESSKRDWVSSSWLENCYWGQGLNILVHFQKLALELFQIWKLLRKFENNANILQNLSCFEGNWRQISISAFEI